MNIIADSVILIGAPARYSMFPGPTSFPDHHRVADAREKDGVAVEGPMLCFVVSCCDVLGFVLVLCCAVM